jgi:hypothetical protein
MSIQDQLSPNVAAFEQWRNKSKIDRVRAVDFYTLLIFYPHLCPKLMLAYQLAAQFVV